MKTPYYVKIRNDIGMMHIGSHGGLRRLSGKHLSVSEVVQAWTRPCNLAIRYFFVLHI
jgi:hypothetical protein